MDDTRFDDLARTLGVSASRRQTLGGLLGALATVGLVDTEDASAAKSGDCNNKCDPCERCKKGACHRNKHGKRKCQKGTCIARATGSSCVNDTTNATGTCQSDGRCCRNTTVLCSDTCGNVAATPCSVCCSGTCNVGVCA